MTKTKGKKKGIIIILCFGLIILALIISCIVCNHSLKLTEYSLSSEDLPQSFDGFKVAQVSDLHNQTHGKDNRKLLNILQNAEPDIIVITGDMIDSRNTNTEIAVEFARQAVKIAPCYYVAGNHEARVPADFETLLAGLTEAGVTILRNGAITLENNNDEIYLLGADDPWFTTGGINSMDEAIMAKTLGNIVPTEKEKFTLLLSHRPELFELYAKAGIDLTLSGHAHGGQIRLPFIGGLYAPDQGLLPKLEKGMFTQDNSCMIVSCGVGNSLFPLRFLNPPEVVLVTLSK